MGLEVNQKGQITGGTFILRPAYGRRYTFLEQVEADFLAGKDFLIEVPTEGRMVYCSRSDFAPGTDIRIFLADPTCKIAAVVA
jgi:hypothetical protein